VIEQLAGTYPVHLLCRLFGFPRSSFYPHPPPRQEETLRQALVEVAGAWPTYGYRRLTAEWRRQGGSINEKRVRRLMHELGLQGKVYRRWPRTTDRTHAWPRYPNRVAGLTIERPDQVWVADLTYVRLRQGWVYLAVLLDVFTRGIRGWHLARGLDGSLSLLALQRVLASGTPEIHHSDQGVQYAAWPYERLLQEHGVTISMAAVGEPRENGYAERFIRTIKEEEVDLTEYEDFHDARRQLGRFLEDVYQRKRIHSSLGYLTPAEFEARWRREHAEPGGLT
jgi:transposase InsO family protein